MRPLPETALPEDLLKDLYYTATDHKKPNLAAECARRLYANHGDDENRLRLAIALNSADQPLEAFIVVFEPGGNVPAHLFVGGKQETRP